MKKTEKDDRIEEVKLNNKGKVHLKEVKDETIKDSTKEVMRNQQGLIKWRERQGPKLKEIQQFLETIDSKDYRLWDSAKREFEETMKNGGFDVCIGNPPWGADLSKNADYLERVYDLAEGQYDSYELFVELSKKILKKGGGQ